MSHSRCFISNLIRWTVAKTIKLLHVSVLILKGCKVIVADASQTYYSGTFVAPLPLKLTVCFPLYNPGTLNNSKPRKISKAKINLDASLLILTTWVLFGFSYKSLWLQSYFFSKSTRHLLLFSCASADALMLFSVFPVLDLSLTVFVHTRHWRRGSQLHQAKVSETSADTFFIILFFLNHIQPAWCHIGPW